MSAARAARRGSGKAHDLQHVESWTKGHVGGQEGAQDLQGPGAARCVFVLKIWNCLSLKESS